MKYPGDSSFIRSVQGKVIIAFLAGCIALLLAWGFSNSAFRKILHTVENLSAPDERLRLVNSLFLDITRLNQSQRTQALLSEKNVEESVRDESDGMIRKLDSLSALYTDNASQVARVDSMKKILKARDSLLINYFRVRQGLVNSELFGVQMDSLSGLIAGSASQIDSTVVTTERKRLTTTVFPRDSSEVRRADSLEERKRGLLNRIFGKKKEVEEDRTASAEKSAGDTLSPRKIVEEEVNITVDTLALARQDSLLWEAEMLMGSIREDQRLRAARFINQEIELINAGNILINEMLSLLQEVERETLVQTELSNGRAKQVTHDNVQRIIITMLIFFLVTAVLVYLILSDMNRSSHYQRQLEAAKEEAEYHSMAKQRFLSNMSHEIRTPLQSIIGYAELVKQQERPEKKYLKAIYYSSEHLLHIVNEALDYNRIISGKLSFREEIFSIRELLDEVIATMRLQAEQKGLKLAFYADIGGTGFVKGDPFRLKQILYNLLGNAVKFTQQGSVSLTVLGNDRRGRTHFTFVVDDTGIGIREKDIQRIFNQFEQADGTSGKYPGTGLGLSIVKALTEKMGGTIVVKALPERGTRFRVNVRLRTAQPVEGMLYPGSEPREIRYRGKIWVVDDDQLILNLCASLFQKYQIAHACFDSPEALLNSPWDPAVKLMLIDIRMPGMDGTDLCKRLRETVPDGLKIIALTAQVLPGEREAILSQGFDGLLMKPFHIEELIKLLESEAGAERLSERRQRSLPPVNPPAGEKPGRESPKTGSRGMKVVADPDGRNGHERPREGIKPVNGRSAVNGKNGHQLDLSGLKKMTFGDPAQLKMVLEQFAEDTSGDSGQLRTAAKAGDREQSTLLLHRMAGRMAQVGARELAARYRKAETTLRKEDTGTLENEQQEEIYHLIREADALIHKIRHTPH